MSPADRNKILIAGGVALLAIIVIVVFVRGRQPRQPAGGTGGFTTAAGAPAEGTGVPPAPGEAAPTAPGAGVEPAATEGAEGAAPAAGEGPLLGVVRIASGPAEPTRPDPFETFEPPPQPTPPELLVSLPPVGLEPGGLRPGGPSEGPRIAGRRVAGLLFNDQAWAILEEDSETFIVKPGDIVDGIRITAIARDSIFVVDSDGRRWEVPLRGLGPSVRASSAAVLSVSGMPEMPPAAP